MEIRVLHYFLTVAREGNITRAAKLLHITQPTLSRQLMQLEDQLGAALFIRGKRKIILTEEGMILKRRAEEIISLSKKAELEIGDQSHEVNGEITIGCGITEATNSLGKLIQKFKERYPNVTFHLKNGNSDYIIENMDNGLIDIGIVLQPVELDKLNFVSLKEEEIWGILMKKDAPLAKQDVVIAKDLIDLPLIHSGRMQTQQFFSNWYGKQYQKLHFCATSDLSTTASMLVKNDIGYAIIIEGAMQDAVDKTLCFRPFYPKLSTHSLIVWKKYQSFSFTVSKFIDFLSKECK